MVCSKCNHEYEDSLERCPLCGEPNPSVQEPRQTSYGPQDGPGAGAYGPAASAGAGTSYSGAPEQDQPAGQGPGSDTDPGRGYGRRDQDACRPGAAPSGPPARLDAYAPAGPKPSTVLVMGILSILIPFVGVVLAILGLVWGSKAKGLYQPGDANYNMAQAGWILSIVGLVYQALIIVYFVVVMSFISDIMRVAMSYSGYGSGFGDFSDFSDLYPYY